MGAGRSLAETLQAVVDGVVDGLGFGIAVLNLRHPDGKFEVIAVAGSPEAREALLGTVSAADIFDAEFAIADEWAGLRFVPHERLPEGEVIGWVPDLPVSDDPAAWHPLDALFDGHEAGDRALREIAARLAAGVRHGNTVARLGGDEFAVLAEDIAGDDLATLIARLEAAVSRPLPNISVKVATSIGTVPITPAATDLDTLLHEADQAMYAVKQRRN